MRVNIETSKALGSPKKVSNQMKYQEGNGYLNDRRLESFGHLLDDYVITGAELTIDDVDVQKIHISEGIISFSDQLWRVFISDFIAKEVSTTYYVGFLIGTGYVFGITEPTEKYMRLWSIETDLNGVPVTFIDFRGQLNRVKFKAIYDGVYLNTEEVEQAVASVTGAVENAEKAVIDAEKSVEDAKAAIIEANDSATLAKNATTNAEAAADSANQAIIDVNAVKNATEQVRIDTILAKENTEKATTDTIEAKNDTIIATTNAVTVTNEASQKIIDVQNATVEAIERVDQKIIDVQEQADDFSFVGEYNPLNIYQKNNVVYYKKASWTYTNAVAGVGVSPPDLPTKFNTHWHLLALPGEDGTGTGTVTKVDGALPNDSGEVTTHTNKEILDQFDEVSEKLIYKGSPVGAVTSVNGATGDITGLETIINVNLKDDQTLLVANQYTDSNIVTVNNNMSVINDNLSEGAPIQVTALRGLQVVNVPIGSPVNVLNFTGKTVINYAPLFDSGLWTLHANAVVNSPNKITLNATASWQHSFITNIPVVNGKTYTIKFDGNINIHLYKGNVTVNDLALSFANTPGGVPYTFTVDSSFNGFLSISLASGSVGTLTAENVMLNEGTTAKEFVANVKGVTNPTIEIKGENLLPTEPSDWELGTYSSSGISTTATNNYRIRTKNKMLKVKPDQILTIGVNPSYDLFIHEYANDSEVSWIKSTNVWIKGGQHTFTTSSTTTRINVVVSKSPSDSLTPISIEELPSIKPMLNVGTTPKPFEPYRSDSLTVLGTFHEGENPTVDKGQAKVVRKKKEVVLDGSLGWAFSASVAGRKTVTLVGFNNTVFAQNTVIGIKYNGKILPYAIGANIKEDIVRWTDVGALSIEIPNTDSGWGDSYSPTADEIKAYFMGWRMCKDGVKGTPYNGVGVKYWHSLKEDGTESTTYVFTNVPTYSGNTGFNPYRLLYDLATPITEIVKTIGSLKFAKGDNNVELTDGRIVRERIYPVLEVSPNRFYAFNTFGSGSYANSPNKHKTNNIIKVYKNGKEDSHWIIADSSNSYGGKYGYILAQNFDTTAIYEVDYIPFEPYKVSAYTNPITIEYRDSLGGVVEELVDDVTELESRVRSNESVLGEVISNAPNYAKKTQEAWKTAVLRNGWGNGNVNYKKDDFGNVIVRGVLNTIGTITGGTVVCDLPVGYRPLSYIPVMTNKGNVGPYDSKPLFLVKPNGDLTVSHNETFPTTGTTLASLYFEVTYSTV